MNELNTKMRDITAAETYAAEELLAAIEPLKKEHEAALRRKFGFGINRVEKKKIDKMILKETELLEKKIRKRAKDALHFLTFFDKWDNVDVLNKRVEGIYDYMNKPFEG